jgi:alpha-glucosidase
MIMTEIHAVIERHIIFMVRRWQELLITGKRFAYQAFIITRSAYAGAQRYSSSWTGDNVGYLGAFMDCKHTSPRMSISGMGFTGSDIGGFAEQPSGDLYARWIQLGVFILFVGHTLQGIMEIRSHGHLMKIIDITRKFVNLRYQLLPYLYTMFWQYIEEGIPMLKPLVYYDQSDIQTHYRNDRFILETKF